MRLVCAGCKCVYLLEENSINLSTTYCPNCGILTQLTKYFNKTTQRLNPWLWRHRKVYLKEITISTRIKPEEEVS
jgi:hypothetical protein